MQSKQTFFGFRKLPARNAGMVMPFILSIFMTCIVSLISTTKTVNWDAHFWPIWLGNWGVSWLIAFPVLLLILPVVRKLTSLVVATA